MPSVDFGQSGGSNMTDYKPPSGSQHAYKPSQATDSLRDKAQGAVDSVKNAVDDVVERGQAYASQAGTAATEMADAATQQVKTFASELEAMTRRNPIGTIAGAVVVGILIGLLARGRTAA
jgi:ElaB/YqjD/DUF883 family membrane-anchored ribosome-binding protein